VKYWVVAIVALCIVGMMCVGCGYKGPFSDAPKKAVIVTPGPVVATPVMATDYPSMLISSNAALALANSELVDAQGQAKTLAAENAKLEKNWSCESGIIIGVSLEILILISVILLILVYAKPTTIATDAGWAAGEAQTIEADVLALLAKVRGKKASPYTSTTQEWTTTTSPKV
jgi:hypothetical protein